MSSFFFFKQKTAYEMRISDWSSDVCSSDLDLHRCQAAERALHARLALVGIHAGGAEHLRRGRIQFQRRIALARGLLGAAVGIVQSALQGAGERDRRDRADRHPRLDRAGLPAACEAARSDKPTSELQSPTPQ